MEQEQEQQQQQQAQEQATWDRLVGLCALGAWTDDQYIEAMDCVYDLREVLDVFIDLMMDVNIHVSDEDIAENAMCLAARKLGRRADIDAPRAFSLCTFLHWLDMVGRIIGVKTDGIKGLIERADAKTKDPRAAMATGAAIRLSRVLAGVIGGDAAWEAATCEYRRNALPEWSQEALKWIGAARAQRRVARARALWPWAGYRMNISGRGPGLFGCFRQ